MGSYNDSRRKSHRRRDNQIRRDAVTRARYWIYVGGKVFSSTYVECRLRPWSWTPTLVSRHPRIWYRRPYAADSVQNAFSERLRALGFDFHDMIVPDLLHEFELGVFKATFTHLIRILYAAGREKVVELNKR